MIFFRENICKNQKKRFEIFSGVFTSRGLAPKNFKTFFLVFRYIFPKEYHSTIVIIFIFNFSLYVQSTLLTIALFYINFLNGSTQATISEVQRLAQVVPLSGFNRTLSTTQMDGFTFPAGSVFFANLSFIMKDPNNFPQPEMFDPARFIGDNAKLVLL